MADKAFTFTAAGRVNVLHCPVQISIASLLDPQLQYSQYVAIWDTGATNSVITKKIADDLGLKPIGMTQVSTAGGQKDCNIYLVNIMLPNSIEMTNVRVTEAPLNGFDVLIGMDIIGIGDFAVSTNRTGDTVVSYRVPHDGEVDFVKIAEDEDKAKLLKKTKNLKRTPSRKQIKAKRKQAKKSRKQTHK